MVGGGGGLYFALHMATDCIVILQFVGGGGGNSTKPDLTVLCTRPCLIKTVGWGGGVRERELWGVTHGGKSEQTDGPRQTDRLPKKLEEYLAVQQTACPVPWLLALTPPSAAPATQTSKHSVLYCSTQHTIGKHSVHCSTQHTEENALYTVVHGTQYEHTV